MNDAVKGRPNTRNQHREMGTGEPMLARALSLVRKFVFVEADDSVPGWCKRHAPVDRCQSSGSCYRINRNRCDRLVARSGLTQAVERRVGAAEGIITQLPPMTRNSGIKTTIIYMML